MPYLIKSNIFFAFCLSFVIFITGCSTALKKKESTVNKPLLLNGALKNIENKSYINSVLKKSININGGNYLNISNLHAKFSPDYIMFDVFFKSNLPNKSYRTYMDSLNKKIKSLAVISSGIRYKKGKIFSKEKISVRKRRVKKEWVWGKKKKSKMKAFYNFFRKSGITYEYKIIFNPIKKDFIDIKGDEDKKTGRTNRSIVVFMYQRKKSNDMYIIDPDIFIDSVL